MMTATKERPILFSGEMVRAILEGRKTQTRRMVKPQPKGFWGDPNNCIAGGVLQAICHDPNARNMGKISDKYIRVPYGVPGDRLWVRETWQVFEHEDVAIDELRRRYRDGQLAGELVYKADDPNEAVERWRSGLHLPREFSRITLGVTGVRVERLQEISEADCAAEGIATEFHGMPVGGLRWEYAAIWDRINGAGSWDANPWVWVVEFKRVGGAA